MKKIKFMAMLLMATMALGFTACSDDEDDAPSIEDINANLEGEWFLVKSVCSDSEDGTETEVWDAEDMTSKSTEGSSPIKMVISKVDDGVFSFTTKSYYSGRWSNTYWYDFSYETIELENNFIMSWDDEGGSDGESGEQGGYYIEKLTENELVIVMYENDYDGTWHKDTDTFVRID